jgi:hypothetical protein
MGLSTRARWRLRRSNRLSPANPQLRLPCPFLWPPPLAPPEPRQNVSTALQPDTSANIEATTLDAARATRAGLNATFSTLQVGAWGSKAAVWGARCKRRAAAHSGSLLRACVSSSKRAGPWSNPSPNLPLTLYAPPHLPPPQRRLRLDPFLPVYTRFQPTRGYVPMLRAWGDDTPFLPGPSPVDIPDAKYLEDYTTKITKFPDEGPVGYGFGFIPPMALVARSGVANAAAAMMPAPAPAAAPPGALAKGVGARAQRAGPVAADAAVAPSKAEAGGAGGSAAGPAVRLQSAFRVTPVFAVAVTGPDGAARFPVRGPENLGAFVLRAYAAAPPNGEAATAYGAGEAPLVVRRGVSLVPSAPRIVRAGDAFEAGVIVSRPGAGPDAGGRVSVQASASGPEVVLASGRDADEKGADVAGGGQQEVRFRFAAKQVGVLTWRRGGRQGGVRRGEVACS